MKKLLLGDNSVTFIQSFISYHHQIKCTPEDYNSFSLEKQLRHDIRSWSLQSHSQAWMDEY